MEKELKGLKILHYSFCFGTLMIIILLHFFIRPITFAGLNGNISTMGFVALFIASGALLLSNFTFKNQLSEIGTDQITSENIGAITRAYITKWAFLVGASQLNTLFYFFMDESPILIIVALLLLLLLFVSKPNFNN